MPGCPCCAGAAAVSQAGPGGGGGGRRRWLAVRGRPPCRLAGGGRDRGCPSRGRDGPTPEGAEERLGVAAAGGACALGVGGVLRRRCAQTGRRGGGPGPSRLCC